MSYIRIHVCRDSLCSHLLSHSRLYVVEDSKCDYPAACNAMETLLIHRELIGTDVHRKVVQRLRDNEVRWLRGCIPCMSDVRAHEALTVCMSSHTGGLFLLFQLPFLNQLV